MSSTERTQGGVAAELPQAPYLDYSPLPGVVPQTDAPQFQQPWGCIGSNKCVVTASQPVIPVPVQQEILRKEKIIEVDQTIVTDKIQPKVWKQEVFHEVPKLAVDIRERKLNIPRLKIEERNEEVPVAVGFNFTIQPTWDEREVPRLFPKYSGKQEVIEIGIPQIQIVDKKIENEVPIYVGEKHVDKEVIEEEGMEVMSYKYVKQEEEIPVYKYRPVFDVEVSIPPPVVVPVPVAPQERSLETEHIPFAEYIKQKRERRLIAKSACTGATVCGVDLNCCPGVPGCEPRESRYDEGVCSAANWARDCRRICGRSPPVINHPAGSPPPALQFPPEIVRGERQTQDSAE